MTVSHKLIGLLVKPRLSQSISLLKAPVFRRFIIQRPSLQTTFQTRGLTISRRLLATAQPDLPKSSEEPKSAPPPRAKLTREQYAQLVEDARNERQRQGIMTSWYYSASVVVAFLTLAYAAVPFYRIICQQSGFMGAPVTDTSKFTPEKLIPIDHHKRIRISFSSNTSTSMPWKFTPQQREVKVLPGETALAFYKAKNPTDSDIIGMATYSVVPEKAAPYFSKIQCFCFEEQRLAAGEEVDMPVFFFIDPDFVNDPLMRNVDDIILNYTFFRARYDENGVLTPVTGADGLDLHLPPAAVAAPVPAIE